MAAKKKRGGRVTPKGTQQAKTTKDRTSEERHGGPATSLPGHVPQRVRNEQGRGTRPITHNRGNR